MYHPEPRVEVRREDVASHRVDTPDRRARAIRAEEAVLVRLRRWAEARQEAGPPWVREVEQGDSLRIPGEVAELPDRLRVVDAVRQVEPPGVAAAGPQSGRQTHGCE